MSAMVGHPAIVESRATPRLPGSATERDLRLLRKIRLPRELEDDWLLRVARQARRRSYRRGEKLAHPTPADTVYLIAQGEVHHYRVADDGQRVTLRRFPGGTCFYFRRFAPDGAPVSVAEACADETITYLLRRQLLRQIITAHPSLALQAMECFDQMLADAYDRIEDLALCSTEARLAHALARLARSAEHLVVKETHAELAALVGTRQEEVTKKLRHLRDLGLIAYEPHQHGIAVLALDKLATY